MKEMWTDSNLRLLLVSQQICRALAYIHGGIGVCHRDIKPQNLLVCFKNFMIFVVVVFWKLLVDKVVVQVNPHTHQVKLCDFGSAKVLVGSSFESDLSTMQIFFLVVGLLCCFYSSFLCIMLILLPFHSLLSGERRAKYIIYLFSLLSSTRTNIRGYWIHYRNWYMVCRLRSCRVTSWTGTSFSFFAKQGRIRRFSFPPFLSLLSLLLACLNLVASLSWWEWRRSAGRNNQG